MKYLVLILLLVPSFSYSLEMCEIFSDPLSPPCYHPQPEEPTESEIELRRAKLSIPNDLVTSFESCVGNKCSMFYTGFDGGGNLISTIISNFDSKEAYSKANFFTWHVQNARVSNKNYHEILSSYAPEKVDYEDPRVDRQIDEYFDKVSSSSIDDLLCMGGVATCAVGFAATIATGGTLTLAFLMSCASGIVSCSKWNIRRRELDRAKERIDEEVTKMLKAGYTPDGVVLEVRDPNNQVIPPIKASAAGIYSACKSVTKYMYCKDTGKCHLTVQIICPK